MLFVVPVPVALVGYLLLYMFCRHMGLPDGLGKLLFVVVVGLHLWGRHRRQAATVDQQAAVLDAALRKMAEKR